MAVLVKDGLILHVPGLEVELDALCLEDIGEAVGSVAGHRGGWERMS